jgi:pimeloyl-ACP methyl ester carboxylesterase
VPTAPLRHRLPFPLLAALGFQVLAGPVLSLLPATTGLAAQAAVPAATPAAATLKFEPCRLEHPLGLTAVPAECATLEVPENRAAGGGRHIGLFIARIPALSRNHAGDPLFVLAGGPGLAATTFYASVAPVFERARRDRDIVLVDQRGTGRSAPLNCAFDDDQMWDVDEAETARLMRECRLQLEADHDLAQYTTSVAVTDLDAVRAAMGYARLNLYGSSYGTRVAQHYARRFPQRTRALILDGIVPPTRVLGPTTPLDAERTLQRILARCREDVLCAQRFGNPSEDYEALRARLDTAPVPIEIADPRTGKPMTLDFSAQVLAGALRLSGYSAEQAALLPLALEMANRENQYTPLAAQFLITASSYDAVLSYGMHNSVVCAEDVPLFDREPIDRDKLAATFLGTAQIDSLRAMCEEWPRGPVDADLHSPLRSKAPALLMSGTADPVTPVTFGEEAAAGFLDVLHLKVRDQGHGQLVQPCVDRLMAQFLERAGREPAATLDVGCALALQPPPFFLTLGGPGP